MTGMSRQTGKVLSSMEHLRQSITDILTTPIGSRVMRRDYGSRLFELIDQPMTAALEIDIIAAVAEAIELWEPRLKLSKVSVQGRENGHLTLGLYGSYVVDGRDIELEGLMV